MKMLKRLFAVIAILCCVVNASAQTTKTWVGTTTAWATAGNWSPSGVPAGTDHVVFNGSGTAQPTLDNNRSVANITVTGNTVNLNSKVLTVTGTTTLTAGTVNSGTINFTNTTTTFGGTTFGSKVKGSCANIYFNGSTFNGSVSMTKTGTAANSSTGGNTFNDSLIIKSNGYNITFHSTTNNDAFNGHIVLSSSACATCPNHGIIAFGAVGGTGVGTLASGKTITIGGGGFAQGGISFIRFTQSGSTAQSFTLTGTAQLKLGDKSGATLAPTTWNGNVTLSSPNVLVENSTFNGTATITKTGSSSNTCNGNNTFNSTCTYNVNSTGYLTLANITGDVYNSTANFNQNSTGLIYPGNNGDNYFYGNVAIITNNNAVTFNNSGSGYVTFRGSAAQTLSKTGTGLITLNRLTMGKTANSLTLSTPVKLGGANTFDGGTVITTSTNILTFKDNATCSVTNSASYVSGPVAKEGNDAFTFPTGKNSMYRSLGIAAPTNTATVFTAEYFNSNQGYGAPTDTSLSNFSNCEYWTLTRSGSSDNVNVTPSWNSSSCNGARATNMRVASWNGSTWLNLGNGARTGNNTAGTVTTGTTPTAFNAFTLANKTCSYAATITPTGATSFCSGGSVLLTANSSKYYSWSTSVTTQAITASTGGTYSVTVRDTSGCKGTTNQAVYAGTISFTMTNDTMDVGEKVVFTNTSTGFASGATFYWDFGDCLAADTSDHFKNNLLCKDTIVGNDSSFYSYANNYNYNVKLTLGSNNTCYQIFPISISGPGPVTPGLGGGETCFSICGGSFDDVDTSPLTHTAIMVNDFGQVNFLKGNCWGNIRFFEDLPLTSNSTPDLYMSNAQNTFLDVPINGVGTQPSFVTSNPLQGYTGICTYASTNPTASREYIVAPITGGIAPGQSYSITFYASLADCAGYATQLEAALSENLPDQTGAGIATFTGASIINTTTPVINNKDVWQQISFVGVNNTAETLNWLTIGRFNASNVNTAVAATAGQCNTPPTWLQQIYTYAYYYIDEVSVDQIECCQGTDLTINGGTASDLFTSLDAAIYIVPGGTSTNYAIDNSAAGGTIAINGTFTIDIPNFTFQNCNVVLSANAKIEFSGLYNQSRTFNIDNSWLHACDQYLWDGVYCNNLFIVSPNRTVNVTNGSLIEDAQNAIVSMNGGDINISASTFNKNYRHIWVKTYNNNHGASIFDNTFECTAAPLAKYPTAYNPVPTQTRFAIHIDNVLGITIGNNTQGINTFTQSDVGVYSQISNTLLSNNEFNNYSNGQVTTLANLTNFAVYSRATAVLAAGSSAKISSLRVLGDVTNSTKNTFNNCRRGVYSIDNVNTVITRNYFDYGSHGVVMTDCKNNALTVQLNDMDDYRWGISSYFNVVSALFIGFNNINFTTDPNILTYSNVGITAWEDQPLYTPFGGMPCCNNVVIRLNNIDNYRTGIVVRNIGLATTNSNNIRIADDNLQYTSPVRAGINMFGCFNTGERKNTIWSLASVDKIKTNNTLEGIRHNGGALAFDDCNYINSDPLNSYANLGNLKYSISFNGPGNLLSLVRGNILQTCHYGLTLRNNGLIGDQIAYDMPGDNQWLQPFGDPLPFNNGHIYTYNTNAFAQTYYYRQVGTGPDYVPWKPINSYTNGFNTFMQVAPGDVAQVFSCGTYDWVYTPTPPESPLQKMARLVAQDSVRYPVDSLAAKYISQAKLYKAILYYGDSLTSVAALDSFKTVHDTSNIGRMALISHMLGTGFITNLSTQLTDSTAAAADSAQYFTKMFDIDTTAIYFADSMLTAFTPHNNIERTEKAVRRVILNGKMNAYIPGRLVKYGEPIDNVPMFNYSNADRDTLAYYAALCPYVYGDDVFTARAILMTQSDTLLHYWSIYYHTCEVPDSTTMRLSNEKSADITPQGIIKVYPNPANESVFIDLGTMEPQGYSIQVFDITGKMHYQTTLQAALNTISTIGFKPGLYIANVLKDGKAIERKKLSVIHN